MPYAQDHTRRDFLLTLARATVFVPPVMATVGLSNASAAVKKVGVGNQGNGIGNTIGGLSPTAQIVASPTFAIKEGAPAASSAPWGAGKPSDPAPWAAPPPAAQNGG